MFRRLFWLVVGIGFGFGLSYWVSRALRRAAERYTPQRVSGDLAGAVRSLGADVRAAVAEGRAAMREREAELRAATAPPLAGPAPAGNGSGTGAADA